MEKQKLIGRSGVYAILINDVIRYIGSSASDLESRQSNHLRKLKKGTHRRDLQKLYDESGGDFKFYVLDYCDSESVYILEKLHIEIHKDTIVDQEKIIKLDKHIRTKEEKREISKKFSKIMRGENNPNSKISEQQAIEIIIMKQQGIKHKDIADIYGISQSQIAKIGYEKWSYLS
ncbi:GIY-YIG nuclease family protein [Tissierella sp.]|uniref:GIY-YIG nuclease family protein n=1 Tax=Tissierella sp. TaxID=41274 RepID=UPI0030558F3C